MTRGRANNPTLNLRQKAFAVHYLANGGNAKKAAEDAGFARKNAASYGHELLQNPLIQKMLGRKGKRMEKKASDIRLRLEQIAFQDVRKALSWGPDGVAIESSEDLDEDTAMAISGVKQTMDKEGFPVVSVEFHDPRTALALLAKIEGLDKPDPAGTTFVQNNLNVVLMGMSSEQLAALQDIASDPKFECLHPVLGQLLVSGGNADMAVEEAPE